MLHVVLFIKNSYSPANRIPRTSLCSQGKHAARFPLWREGDHPPQADGGK